jgi:HSP20 family protein
MRLIPWKPLLDQFDDMDAFMQPYRSMMPAVGGGIIPPVDIYEKGASLIVETPLAGVDPNKVDVTVEHNVLTIRGGSERKTEVEEKNYYRKEVRTGTVFRQIPLPVEVIGEKADATYDQGMLKISIPKAKSEKEPKHIKINVKKGT